MSSGRINSAPTLVGESFDKAVKSQINARQTIFGKANHSDRELLYTNDNGIYMFLASAVQPPTGISGAYGSTPEELSREYVISGGTFAKWNGTNGGKLDTDSIANDPRATSTLYGYGFLSSNDWGLVPPPGILSIQVETKGDYGSIKQGTVKLRAFSKNQFELIEILFLRLGYTVAVEFGHTYAVDSSGSPYALSGGQFINSFLAGKVGDIPKYYNSKDDKSRHGHDVAEKTNPFKAINSNAKVFENYYDYNMCCFAGKVVNYDWSFSEEGYYDITLKISSYGDLLDSIQVSTRHSPSSTAITEDPPDDKYVKKLRNVSDISGFLYLIWEIIYNSDLGSLDGFLSRHCFWGNDLWGFYKANQYVNNSTSYIGASYLKSVWYSLGIAQSYYDVIDVDLDDSSWMPFDHSLGDNYTDDKYMTLGMYLEVLNQFVILYNNGNSSGQANVESDGTGILHIRNEDQRYYCMSFGNQLSGDPKVCIFPGNIANISTTSYSYSSRYTPSSLSSYGVDALGTSRTIYYKSFKHKLSGCDLILGDIMSLYINFEYLSKLQLDILQAEGGKISLRKHLEDLLSGISNALGSINKFVVKVDEDSGEAYIIDENLQLNPYETDSLAKDYFYKKDKLDKAAVFNVYGIANSIKGASGLLAKA